MGRRFKSFNRRAPRVTRPRNLFERPFSPVIITCPHCRTRYKVAADAISAAGRQVQCATCQEAWTATPSFPKAAHPLEDFEPSADEMAFSRDEDRLFTEADEAMMDAGFTEEAPESESALDEAADPDQSAAPLDPRIAAARRSALAKRRRKIDRTMPLARFRRASRWVAAAALAGVLALGFGLRGEIVRLFPEFGMIYEALGLPVNVVGLDFSDVRTLRTTRDGIEVLMVTANLTNVAGRLVDVPPVLVSLLGPDGAVVYAWTVTPTERQVPADGTIGLETQLTSPPLGIERVRLTFVQGQSRPGP